MNSVLRAAIVFLLLVALPLQGYTAGAMLFCGTSSGTAGAAGHDLEDASNKDADAHDHDAILEDGGDADVINLHAVMHGKCSVCSSCCSAAALPSTPLAATSATPRAAPLPDLRHADWGCAPARLERPPRLNLA